MMMRPMTAISRAAVLGARAPVAMPACTLGARRVFAPVAAPAQQARCFSFTAPTYARGGRDLPEVQHHQRTEVQQQTQSEFDALTPVARKYLSRVYGNTAAGGVSLGVGAGLMLLTPLGAAVPYWAPMLASFVPLVGLSMGYGRTQKARLGMYHGFASLFGMGVAPVVAVAKFSGILAPAIGLTGATFAGFSAAALMAPAGSSVKMQGPLYAGLLGLIGVQVFSLFFPTPLGQQLMMYGGLALFSLFIASDTGAMIERANAGQEDIVGDSINCLINLVNVFTRIVAILRGED